MNKISGILLVIISVAVAIAFLVIASQRDLTGLENTLLQVISLGVGLIGSYVLGKESAQKSAREMIKPHARSAFRRLLSLYKSLSRLASAIQEAKGSVAQNAQALNVLEGLEGIVIEQIATADDALEDWNDVVPEEVASLRAQLRSPNPTP